MSKFKIKQETMETLAQKMNIQTIKPLEFTGNEPMEGTAKTELGIYRVEMNFETHKYDCTFTPNNNAKAWKTQSQSYMSGLSLCRAHNKKLQQKKSQKNP